MSNRPNYFEITHYKDINGKPVFNIWFPHTYMYYTYHHYRAYYSGQMSPRYPVPARFDALNFISASPIGPKEDFFDIGYQTLKKLR